jgi:hypothetical protein
MVEVVRGGGHHRRFDHLGDADGHVLNLLRAGGRDRTAIEIV